MTTSKPRNLHIKFTYQNLHIGILHNQNLNLVSKKILSLFCALALYCEEMNTVI